LNVLNEVSAPGHGGVVNLTEYGKLDGMMALDKELSTAKVFGPITGAITQRVLPQALGVSFIMKLSRTHQVSQGSIG
jgi:hypothetical protein